MSDSNKQNNGAKDHTQKILPFWLQIVLILACGGVLSIGAYIFAHNNREVERESSMLKHTVTFAYQDGSIIETRSVAEGTGTLPPKFETDGVFRGWSGAINEVKSDIEVHPMVYELAGDENLFCFDSVYVQEGKQFSINLRLIGSVSISNAEIEIEFDSEVMDYLQDSSIDICTVSKKDEGTLVLTLDSDTALKEATQLSTLTFISKGKDVLTTQINLHCISGTLIINEVEIPATVSTINNKIYYLQEVN